MRLLNILNIRRAVKHFVDVLVGGIHRKATVLLLTAVLFHLLYPFVLGHRDLFHLLVCSTSADKRVSPYHLVLY
jgi:hypothetical protein